MAAEAPAGPLCFRVSARERALLELLAESRGQTLSALARDLLMDTAAELVRQLGGVDAVADQAQRRQEAKLQAERDAFAQMRAMAGTTKGLAAKDSQPPN